MIIKNTDIIVVGLQAWDNEIGSNSKNIALEFAKHNRVLFVDYPLDRITIIKHKQKPLIAKRINLIRTKTDNLKEVQKNLWRFFPLCILESVNWIPFTGLFRVVNKINNLRYAAEIRSAIKKLGFKNYLLFIDNDLFRSYHLKEMLQPSLSIYYLRDYLLSVDYWHKHGPKLASEIIRKSDMVIANSTYLTDIANAYNKNIYYVRQGCDIQNFDSKKITNIPKDMAAIKPPIIGYTGALNIIRLDINLLEWIATNKPGWNLVLIGPQDNAFKNSKLHKMSNVFFMGAKKEEELLHYVASFDVAINPQLLNSVTIGNYPRKIVEYLAMGKPVVATETNAMHIFKQQVYLATTKENFVELIEKALQENAPEKKLARINFASTHTWENSVEEIYNAIIKVKPELGNCHE